MVGTQEDATWAWTGQAVYPGDGVLPVGFRLAGEIKELLQRTVGQRFGTQPGRLHPAKLQLHIHNHVRQAQSANGGLVQASTGRVAVGVAVDDAAVGSSQAETPHMLAEAAQGVMVFAVYVVSDGAAHRDKLRPRCDW